MDSVSRMDVSTVRILKIYILGVESKSRTSCPILLVFAAYQSCPSRNHWKYWWMKLPNFNDHSTLSYNLSFKFSFASHWLVRKTSPQMEHNKEWVAGRESSLFFSVWWVGLISSNFKHHTTVSGEKESSNWKFIWHKIDIYSPLKGI